MDRLRNSLSLLRRQLWTLPIMCAAGGIVLAFVLLNYGQRIVPAGNIWWLFSGDAGAARDLLGSLLSGLMTMISLVISVTFVILTLAANQLGPRLISIFMADRQIQAVLGLFIGTIIYVILVLRTLDDTLGAQGVPHLAVTAASVLTILCLLALLFYVHKVARSIIADNVVEAVWQEFRKTLRDILASGQGRQDRSAAFDGPHWQLGVGKVGYVQVIDYDRLVTLAAEAGVRIVVRVRAGHYVLQDGRHLTVYGETPPSDELRHRVRAAITVGPLRTPAQDPEHGIRQLVEIATRALSPGINDFFTALAVIDRLGAALECVFQCELQPCVLRDASAEQRVIADRSDIDGIMGAAFHPIRQAGANNPAVLIRMAEVIADLSCVARKPAHRLALEDHIERIAATVAIAELIEPDRRDVETALARARRTLDTAALPADSETIMNTPAGPAPWHSR
ncbi:DUF2254 domain-containing protein [Orrella sp. JC864]|uniref:DUF2254 domain-containing protein n=1 Tax=Orrella sp. JC864 TaxID=3120298 RepID=UPI00300B5BAE